MIKYHFSLILKLYLRGGELTDGEFQSGEDHPKIFWLQITSNGSIFP